MITPVYKHDCDKCRFVGRLATRDAYICKTSVILRYGNEGHEYESMSKDLVDTTSSAFALKFKIVLMMGE